MRESLIKEALTYIKLYPNWTESDAMRSVYLTLKLQVIAHWMDGQQPIPETKGQQNNEQPFELY